MHISTDSEIVLKVWSRRRFKACAGLYSTFLYCSVSNYVLGFCLFWNLLGTGPLIGGTGPFIVLTAKKIDDLL